MLHDSVDQELWYDLQQLSGFFLRWREFVTAALLFAVLYLQNIHLGVHKISCQIADIRARALDNWDQKLQLQFQFFDSNAY